MEAKVIIGTGVTGWRDCKEMIRTISGLASLQTLLSKPPHEFPECTDGGFVANVSFLYILVAMKIEQVQLIDGTEWSLFIHSRAFVRRGGESVFSALWSLLLMETPAIFLSRLKSALALAEGGQWEKPSEGQPFSFSFIFC